MADTLEDLAALRESVELERLSDLYATAGDFRNASMLMKQANHLRGRVFGHSEVNLLREQTKAAIAKERG